MLLDARQPAKALLEYEAALKISPNRFKALQGAAKSAELAGDRDKAKSYYARLLTVAATSDGQRPELGEARAFVSR
jgi:tetratricopeptide (TPR) repeat protein